jgi:pimeloyl-ACP methyl ester carboxylesterase
VLVPDLLGYGRTTGWSPGQRLGVDDEFRLIEALLDRLGQPAHVVGHSYGGAVAIDAARRFGDRIASVAAIEPVAFHLLRLGAEPDTWREIAHIAHRHINFVAAGRDVEAAEAFVGYWVGYGAFGHLPEPMRAAVIAAMPKVAAEWQLMFAAEQGLAAIAELRLPVLLLCGTRARAPVARVVELLRGALPDAVYAELAGAGHMSPLTHASAVTEALLAHLDAHSAVAAVA